MNISDAIYNATSLYVDAAIKGLSFDSTVICKILSYNEEDNSYVVSNDSISFLAYPEDDAKYATGMLVRVFIPNGNYGNKKSIVGKFSDGDNNNIDYYNSLEDLLLPVEPINIYDSKADISLSKFDVGLGKYQYLGIRYYPIVDYNNIKDYNNIGDYSIKLYSDQDSFEFFSTELIGNPNYQNGKYLQEKIFQLSSNFNLDQKFKIEIKGNVNINTPIQIYLAYDQHNFYQDKWSFQKIDSDNGFCSRLYWIHKDEDSQKFKVMTESDLIKKDLKGNIIGYPFEAYFLEGVDKKSDGALQGEWSWNRKLLKPGKEPSTRYLLTTTTDSIPEGAAAIAHKMVIQKDGKDILSTDYLHWSLGEVGENTVGFITLEDTDYHDGYHLFEKYQSGTKKYYDDKNNPTHYQLIPIYHTRLVSDTLAEVIRNIKFTKVIQDAKINKITWIKKSPRSGVSFIKISPDPANQKVGAYIEDAPGEYISYELSNDNSSDKQDILNNEEQYFNFSYCLKGYEKDIPIDETIKCLIELENGDTQEFSIALNAKFASKDNLKLIPETNLSSLQFYLDNISIDKQEFILSLYEFDNKKNSFKDVFSSYTISTSWLTYGVRTSETLISNPFSHSWDEEDGKIKIAIAMNESLKQALKDEKQILGCYNILKVVIEGISFTYPSGKTSAEFLIPIVLRTTNLYYMKNFKNELMENPVQMIGNWYLGIDTTNTSIDDRFKWEDTTYSYQLKDAQNNPSGVYKWNLQYEDTEPQVETPEMKRMPEEPVGIFTHSNEVYILGFDLPFFSGTRRSLRGEYTRRLQDNTEEKTYWIHPLYVYAIE